MKLSTLLLITGAVWGLLLGTLVAWTAIMLALGVSWVFLFGDNTWPDSVQWIIPLIGALLGLASLAACTTFGWRIALRATMAGPEAVERRTVQGRRLLILGCLLLVVSGGLVTARALDERSQRAQSTQQNQAFAELVAMRQQVVTATTARAPEAMRYELTVTTTGRAEGLYRLDWQVRSSAYDATLAQGTAQHSLSPGDNRLVLALDAWDILQAYHETVLQGRDADVEVDETFQIDLRLTPLLDETVLAELPSHELQNLRLGQSALIDRKVVRFPTRFRIMGAEYLLMD